MLSVCTRGKDRKQNSSAYLRKWGGGVAYKPSGHITLALNERSGSSGELLLTEKLPQRPKGRVWLPERHMTAETASNISLHVLFAESTSPPGPCWQEGLGSGEPRLGFFCYSKSMEREGGGNRRWGQYQARLCANDNSLPWHTFCMLSF